MAHCPLTHRTPDPSFRVAFLECSRLPTCNTSNTFHEPEGWTQFVVFENIYPCLFIPNCSRKIMSSRINDIAYHNYAEAKRAHQVQKEFIQSLQVTLCVPSKQPRTIKTIIYKDIFTSLRRKKVQNPAKQLKELFGLVCYFFALNQPSSALNYLKTSFILTNQDWVIFSCTLSAQKLVYFTLLPDIFFVEVQFF